MNNLIEIGLKEAASIYGGKDKEVAKLVEFIAECIGSICKMIYMANQIRKMMTGRPIV